MAGGSSLIDLLVHRETTVLGRRVFLDYRQESTGVDWRRLSDETTSYLRKCGATADTPLGRLQTMNPAAIQLYRDHGIDLATEPLEIAVCNQHNNGGLSANAWWESGSLPRLFPIGEVNGSHGVYRPGGAALNSGQVGGLRAAECIARHYRTATLPRRAARLAAQEKLAEIATWLQRGRTGAARDWRSERAELQHRMSSAAAQLREPADVQQAVQAADAQWQRLESNGCGAASTAEQMEALRTRSLCLSHRVYLHAIAFALTSGVGSRGSAMVCAPEGQLIHAQLPAAWRLQSETASFREQVQETRLHADCAVENHWVPRRPIPDPDTWFETVWAAFRRQTLTNSSQGVSLSG